MHYQPDKSIGKSNALSQRADHGSGANDHKNIGLLTLDLFAIQALEGLELIREEKEILREIRREMENGVRQEAVAKVVKALQKTSACSIPLLEWLQSQGLLHFHGKIYILDLADICQ